MLNSGFISQQNYYMSKYKTVQFDTDRLNPQFIGITEKYSKKKKERLEVQSKKRSLENSFNHLEKMKDNLEANLTKKKHQLNYLRSVRQRYLDDIRHKMEQDDLNQKKLQQLRSRSSNARKNHYRNLMDALEGKSLEKKRAHDQVRSQLQRIKQRKQQKKQELQEYFEMRQKQLEEQKMLGKSRINKFYRKKNKFLLTSYKELIKNEELNSQKSSDRINFLETKTQLVKDKMNRRESQLKSIEDEIQKYKMTSLDLKNATFDEDFRMSKLTKMSLKSSKPGQILTDHSKFLSQRKNKKRGKKKTERTFMMITPSMNSGLLDVDQSHQKQTQS